MPEWNDCLTDSARTAWAELLLRNGLYPRPPRIKPVSIDTKLETPEEISIIMTLKPRFDKSEVT
jgi:hypothetical protein